MKKIKLIFILSILITPVILICQVQKISILSVTVDGANRLSEEDVIRASRLYEGRLINMEDIQKGIKTLWNLNQVQDIQVFVENESSDGVDLKILVVELPILGDYIIKGNKKLSKSSITDELDLHIGQLISEYDIFETKKAIDSKYKESHYHNVSIEITLDEGEQEFTQNMIIAIKENKKTKIREMIIDGNQLISTRTVLKQLKNTKAKKWYLPWRGGFDKVEFEEDLNSLRAYYTRKGYRDFYVINETVELTDNQKGLKIHLKIYEGPKYYFRNFSWDGNIVHETEELQNRLGFKKGDTYNEEKFIQSISESVSPLYMDEGYFHFMIDPIITPVGEDSIDVHFNIVENEIVKIRKINISGNDKTHENVIRRELRMYPGDIFNRKKLIDSYRDIIILEYFENVIPDVKPVGEDQIDIELKLVEKSADRANFSMGYNGTYGLTGGGGVEFRNFRGRGQTLSINYQRGIGSNTSSSQYNSGFSSTSGSTASYQSFSLSFMNPWVFDTPNLVGLSFYYQERGQGSGNYLPFDIKSIGGSIRWGRRFDWPDRFFRGTWIGKTSNNKYFSGTREDLTNYFSSSIDHLINDEEDSFTFNTSGISISQVISRDSRNHPEFPSLGSRFTWSSTYSGGILGGDEDFHKHEFDFDFYSPIYKKLVLRQKFNMGFLKRLPSNADERSVIPPNSKFFMGGSGLPNGEMLRGYDDNSIGPMGIYSPLGGDIIIKYSLEMRLPLSENPTVYALAFAEVGNVWDDFDNVDPFQFKRSAGIGVRMFMPMLGMIGFDMGYGFDDTIFDSDNKPQGWDYHILFGMPF